MSGLDQTSQDSGTDTPAAFGSVLTDRPHCNTTVRGWNIAALRTDDGVPHSLENGPLGGVPHEDRVELVGAVRP